MGSITVVKWKATSRVGKFGEIMLSAVQFSWLRNSLLASQLYVYAWHLGSDHPHTSRGSRLHHSCQAAGNGYDHFESQDYIIIWVDSASEGDKGLSMEWLLNPAVTEVVVKVVI